MTRLNNGMAAGVIVEDRAWLGRLDGELRAVLAAVFAQARSRLTAFSYIGPCCLSGATASRAGSWRKKPGTARRGRV